MSQRGRAVLHMLLNILLSLVVIGNGTIRLMAYEILLAFHSNWSCLVLFLKESEILVENRDLSYPNCIGLPS